MQTTLLNTPFSRIILFLVLVSAGLKPLSNKAAIVLDASSIKSASSSTTSWSHVTGVGANTVLFVSVVVKDKTINNVKHNGSNMTLFGSVTNGTMITALYYKINPTSGTKTIQVNMSGSTDIRAGAVSYFGVNTTMPLQDLLTRSNTSNNPSATLTSDPGLAIFVLGSKKDPSTVNTTQLFERGSTYFNNVSTSLTLGSMTVNYTMGSDIWGMVAGIVNPVIALPVQFGDLKTLKMNSDVTLNWNMYDLKNATSIIVQRSTDGRIFTNVAEIALPGTSATVDYSYFDKNAPKQRLYYRIAITDIYGKTEYSPVSSINNAGGIQGVKVYPSPSTGMLTIQSGSVIRKIIVLDLLGKELARFNSDEFTISEINISHLDKGIYFLQLIDEEGNTSREKVEKI